MTQIDTLLPWSEPKRVETKNGPRLLRTAPPSDDFSGVWKTNKDVLRQAGISWSKDQNTGEWTVCWWQQIPAAVLHQERVVKEAAQAASRAVDAEIDIPVNEGMAYLGYQKAGIAFGLKCFERKVGVLFGDEMGLGKTVQAIGLINAEPKISRVIVICPASLKLNWHRELSKWLTRHLSIGIADGGCFPTTDIVIINFDIAHKYSRSLTFYWDLMVVDEAHYLKNPKSRRSRAILGYRGRDVEDRQAGIQTRRKAFLTGTPICNRPSELWPLIHALDPVKWSNFYRFAQRYCAAQQIAVGRGKTAWDFAGASNLDELQRELRASIMVRRLKKDVLTELPPKRRQIIEIPCDLPTSKLVREQVRSVDQSSGIMEVLKARVELAKVSDDQAGYAASVQALKEAASVAFEAASELAQEIALAKVPYVVEHVREAVEEGKVILFCHHHSVVDALAREFPACGVVSGRVELPERQAAVDRFMRDPKCQVIIGTIGAMGVGLTLTASHHVVFAELNWVPGNMSQAEDRAHRIGQRDSVLVQHLVLEGSLDARISKTLVEKQAVIDAALDTKTEAKPGQPVGETVSAVELDEPQVPVRAITLTHRQIETEAARMEPEQVRRVHDGLKALAGMCDGARQQDGAGFSRFDVEVGKSLASARVLTPKQAVLGLKLCNKYRRQLGGEP